MPTTPYTPNISGYKPFYIQAEGDSAAKDTAVQWGLVAKTNPYPAMPEPKEPYKNDFPDENGDDEYTAAMRYQAFTFQVQFYVKTFDVVTGNTVTKTAAAVLREQVASFFDHIKNGEFKVFDSYTGLGRQKVRYDGYEEEEGAFKARRNWARLIFTVTFKVNDPVTFMTLSSGSITAIT